MELLSQEYNEKISKLSALLMMRKEHVSTVESCTGGLIAAAFTGFSGASNWYFGSIVAYDDSIKRDVLSVNGQTIKKYGAVSKETVGEMLLSAKNTLKTEWCVAVSGIAGPSGGSREKPLGTVYVGISYKGKILDVSHDVFSGNRDRVRLQAVEKAIDILLLHLEKQNRERV